MKKFLGILMIVFSFISVFPAFAGGVTNTSEAANECKKNGDSWNEATERCITDADVKAEENCKNGGGIWDYEAWKCDYGTAGGPTVQGIRMNDKCLLNGQCGFNIYQFLGLRQSISDNNSPELFVQDILLSATFFIGTIVTITFIVSGLMFIFAGASGKSPDKAKAGIKNSLIGLLIVVSSYSIIRIVQYIAKGL